MRDDAFHFSFLIWLSAGDWWILISERRGKKLSEVSFGVTGHALRIRLWTSFREVYFGSVGQPGEDDLSREFRWSNQTTGYVRPKSIFGLEILNSVSVVVLRHTECLFS